MAKKVVANVKCNTVGDLLDQLSKIAKDPDLSILMDSAIEGPGFESYTGFRIIRRDLSDGSEVLDFEFFED